MSADAGLIRIGGLQPEFDLDAARLCLNFVLVSTLGSNKLAASCVLQKKPATWQVSGVNAPGGTAYMHHMRCPCMHCQRVIACVK